MAWRGKSVQESLTRKRRTFCATTLCQSKKIATVSGLFLEHVKELAEKRAAVTTEMGKKINENMEDAWNKHKNEIMEIARKVGIVMIE